jgi:hypothetical protein
VKINARQAVKILKIYHNANGVKKARYSSTTVTPTIYAKEAELLISPAAMINILM